MAKSRKNLSLKKIKKTTEKVLPVVNSGLETIGRTTKDVAIKSKPYVEKGVSVVYGTLASGFDLGVKGAKSVIRHSKNKTRKSHRKSHRRGGSYRR